MILTGSKLWLAEEVIDHNKNYQVNQFVPGFFAFGSNEGGEMIAFDTRSSISCPVYMIPFIQMNESDSKEIASNFLSFAQLLGI